MVGLLASLTHGMCRYWCMTSSQDGDTALMWAAGEGRVDIVRMLLDLGANIEAKNKARPPMPAAPSDQSEDREQDQAATDKPWCGDLGASEVSGAALQWA